MAWVVSIELERKNMSINCIYPISENLCKIVWIAIINKLYNM